MSPSQMTFPSQRFRKKYPHSFMFKWLTFSKVSPTGVIASNGIFTSFDDYGNFTKRGEYLATNITKQVQFVGDSLNPTNRATLLSLAEIAARRCSCRPHSSNTRRIR